MQLPGVAQQDSPALTEDDARRLIGQASILSISEDVQYQAMAYEIATRLVELYRDSIPGIVSAADVVLSRIGNFPGRALLRHRYGFGAEATPHAPSRLATERAGRELENSVEVAGRLLQPLTDFQIEFLSALSDSPSVSVSAPTSAGKSFVLGLDLIRRLEKQQPACVVYVVPTRALIREVSFEVRKKLHKAGHSHVPIRSAPFPLTPEQAPHGAVYVLTQERLLSLLYSTESDQWITTLIVDEAQGIQDQARGVLLQSAIEAVLKANPKAEVHFASPLSSNPQFLLRMVGREQVGAHLVRILSPVSQNFVLVSEVHRQPTKAHFRLITDSIPLDLGIRDLGFRMRDSPYMQRAKLARSVTQNDEVTLLYANGPREAEKLAEALINNRVPPSAVDADLVELGDYIRDDIHPEYPLIDCLPHKVAYHYGHMPAIIKARIEDLCREGKLQYICCTSTLLQGVNLPARHIIIEKPKRGRDDAMTRGDFLNLAGRAGRLVREFHGNVWCIRPGDWESPVFEGEKLSEIRSAMDLAMSDGGTIIHRVMKEQAAGKEVDYGEAALGKIYCDYVRGGRRLQDSPWRTAENESTLVATEQLLSKMNIMLPTHVLDANRAIRPDRLQALYDYMYHEEDLLSIVPLRPGIPGTNERMGKIIHIMERVLGDTEADNQSHTFYSWLASEWIYNTPLSRIIGSRIDRLRRKGEEIDIAFEVRELLKTLENVIRFRLVKYYMAYGDVLRLVLRDRDYEAKAASVEPFHVYLECGASDRVALNLISLGLTRATALSLRGQVAFPDEASPEQCLVVLSKIDLGKIRMPSLCRREVEDLLGVA
ncbi:MAG: DEAD/DEAH box helicase [Phycisphaerales bacterium JB060]